MAKITEALSTCSEKHPVFYEDEVDIELNPKIGADWYLKGQQKCMAMLGKNQKYYFAGCPNVQTGKMTYVGGLNNNFRLFINILKELDYQYCHSETLALILDNYSIHKSRLISHLKFNLLFLPVYFPWLNEIERLWQSLHETVTRNHCYQYVWQLLEKVKMFLNSSSYRNNRE